MSNGAKLLVTILLALTAAAGLLMSLCGGVMIVVSFGDKTWMTAVLMFAVPFVLVGAGLFWFAMRKLRRRG